MTPEIRSHHELLQRSFTSGQPHFASRAASPARASARRPLHAESLESRVLLACDGVTSWHNAAFPADTNGDRELTSKDALLGINQLNTSGPGPAEGDPPCAMLDTTGDGFFSSLDVLGVINALNRGAAEPEQVNIRLATTAVDSMDPLSEVDPNQDFLLRAYVRDLTERVSNSGVFGAYFDVTYDPALVEVAGDIEFAPEYSTARSGSTGAAGEIDEVGASDGLTPLGLEERLLFSVPMRSLNADGTVTFASDPAELFPAHDTLLFGINDAIPIEEIIFGATSLQIGGGTVNQPPVAEGETYNTGVNETLTRDAAEGVLANDSDPDGDAIAAQVTRLPSTGDLTLNDDGSFTYVPDQDFVGMDSFDYVVNDGELTSGTATATINVVAANQAPVAAPDSYSVDERTTLTVAANDGVLSNDTDPDGDALTATLEQGPSNGTLTLADDGSFTYQPNADFTGDDSFSYTASDGADTSQPASVTITVVDVPEAPVAVDDAYTTAENTTLDVAAAGGVLANDSDPDGDDLTAAVVDSPDSGSVTLNADGSFVYTPNADFSGNDSFTYTASDGNLTSNEATVSIEVTAAQNQAPVANDDSYDVDADTPLTVDAAMGVLANDVDPDGDAVTAQVVDQPADGTLTFSADGSFTYQPNTGFSGIDTFTYVANDGEVDSAPAAVTLDVAAAGPQVAIRLTTTDLDGAPLTEINTGDRFQLRALVEDVGPDPRNGVFAAFADITFDAALAVATGPVVGGPQYNNGVSGNTSTAGLIDEAGSFDGLTPLGPGEFLLFTIEMQANGPGELQFAADPADVFPAHDVLLFDSDDPVPPELVDYGQTTLTVQGVARPTAVDDEYRAEVNQTLTVSAEEGVLANDTTVGGDTLTATLVDATTQGTLTLADDGSFTYEPNPGFSGNDTFTYRAVAGQAESDPATVTIIVGDLAPGGISGSVYFDTNNNGLRDDVEQPFGGVEVRLEGEDLFGAPVNRTTITDRDGSYAFGNLLSGTYVVSQSQPAIVIDGIDAHDGQRSPVNDALLVQLAPGDNAGGYDFGERGLQFAFFGNWNFFSSARRSGGAQIGLGPDGAQSWYCLDSGWDAFQSVQASLSNDLTTLTISAIDLNGDRFQGTVFVPGNRDVQVIRDAQQGVLVRLLAGSASYNLQPAPAQAAAVDEVFAAVAG